MNEAFSFDLAHTPWIPCTDLHSQPVTLSLVETLTRAHELHAVTIEDPLAEFAVVRLLLALAHRVVDGPKSDVEWADMWRAGRFPAQAIASYMERFGNRFDLFSVTHPFGQRAGLINLDSEKRPQTFPITLIMPERASGNSRTLFDHALDSHPPRIRPDQAVMALLATQCFGLCGLNKKHSNLFDFQQSYLYASHAGGINVLLTGDSLYETLCLNMLVVRDNRPIPSTAYDAPAWERSEPEGDSERPVLGLLDYLTASCRHIRLVPERDDQGTFVSTIHLAQGVRFKPPVAPYFIMRQGDDHPIPVLPDVQRLLWRDATALFVVGEEDLRCAPLQQASLGPVSRLIGERTFRVQTYFLANDQATPLARRREALEIPSALLTDPETRGMLQLGMDHAQQTEEALIKALGTFVKVVLPEKSKDVSTLVRGMRGQAELAARLAPDFDRFALDLVEPETAMATWIAVLRRRAWEVFNQVTAQSFSHQRYFKALAKAQAALAVQLAKALPNSENP